MLNGKLDLRPTGVYRWLDSGLRRETALARAPFVVSPAIRSSSPALFSPLCSPGVRPTSAFSPGPLCAHATAFDLAMSDRVELAPVFRPLFTKSRSVFLARALEGSFAAKVLRRRTAITPRRKKPQGQIGDVTQTSAGLRDTLEERRTHDIPRFACPHRDFDHNELSR